MKTYITCACRVQVWRLLKLWCRDPLDEWDTLVGIRSWLAQHAQAGAQDAVTAPAQAEVRHCLPLPRSLNPSLTPSLPLSLPLLLSLSLSLLLYHFLHTDAVLLTQEGASQAGPSAGEGVSKSGGRGEDGGAAGVGSFLWDYAGNASHESWGDHWSYQNLRRSTGGYTRADGASVHINPMLQDWDLAAKLRAELIKRGYEEPSFVSADDGMPFKFVLSQVLA